MVVLRMMMTPRAPQLTLTWAPPPPGGPPLCRRLRWPGGSWTGGLSEGTLARYLTLTTQRKASCPRRLWGVHKVSSQGSGNIVNKHFSQYPPYYLNRCSQYELHKNVSSQLSHGETQAEVSHGTEVKGRSINEAKLTTSHMIGQLKNMTRVMINMSLVLNRSISPSSFLSSISSFSSSCLRAERSTVFLFHRAALSMTTLASSSLPLLISHLGDSGMSSHRGTWMKQMADMTHWRVT